MDTFSLYAASPYFWFFFAALFFGVCISKISKPVKGKNEKDKENKITRKWIIICIYLSIGILLVLAGLFIPGLEKITENPGALFFFFFILIIYFFLAFRFKIAIGLPSSIILILLVIFILLFLQSITAFTGETEIAQVKVHYAKDNVMTLEIIRDVFAWCSVINIALLLCWFIIFSLARGWIYKMHSKWYNLSPDAFDAIHYAGIVFFKMLILVFNLVPYLAMRIVG